VLYFSLHKHCGGSHLYCSFISSKLMRYGSKTSSRCRKMLTLIFTEESEWCIFIFEFAKPPKTEIWLYFEDGLVKAHPRPATHKHQHSQQVTRCTRSTSRSNLDALSGTECMFNGQGLEYWRAVVARVIVSHFLRTMMNGPLYIPSAVNSLSLSSSDDLLLSVLVWRLHAFFTLDAPP